MNATNRNVNLAEMSDDEITNLDATTLPDDDSSSAQTQNENLSATATEPADNNTDVTDGADPVDDSSDDDSRGADSTSDQQDIDPGTDTQTIDQEEQTSASNQEADAGSKRTVDTDESTKTLDYQSEFAKVMAPFKAAKREIKIDNVDDARRLMQMGVDYAQKMQAMKPYRRVLKTLEKNDLVDVDKVNYLIDLSKKNPEAIKKLLKDSEIDPMDLNIEDDNNYLPNDYMLGDNEIALDDVIDEIRNTPAFDQTVNVITKQWDTASRKLLLDNPAIIRTINDHVGEGLFEQIADRMQTERTFGRLSGLSDLEAYKMVGDAMQENGLFKFKSNGSSSTGNTTQGYSQDSGSSSAEAENLRNRKRAASPTKGTASTGKKVPNFLTMSDEDIEKFDIYSL